MKKDNGLSKHIEYIKRFNYFDYFKEKTYEYFKPLNLFTKNKRERRFSIFVWIFSISFAIIMTYYEYYNL